MTVDRGLVFFLNGLTGHSLAFDAVIVFLASYLPYLLVGFYLLLLLLSSSSRIEKLYIFGVATISASIARLGITELIHLFYHRPRPFVTYQLHPLLLDNEWSFPSGHAAFFFAMATAIYLYNKKWGIGFFIATLVVTISRIVAGLHYPSDILGGMIIGMLTAYVVFQVADRTKKKHDSPLRRRCEY
jgi:undecaprenyl-diphosphatase